MKRVLKPRGAFVTTASQPFTSALVMSNPAWFKYSLVWDKKFAGNFALAEKRPMITHEDILVFGADSPQYYPQMVKRDVSIRGGGMSVTNIIGNHDFAALKKTYEDKYPISVLDYPRDVGRTVRPTQKPVALYEYLIKTYTQPGETVLDPFAGSATTFIAALNTGRNCIGGDMTRVYVDLGNRRIANWKREGDVEVAQGVKQLGLFANTA